MSESTFNPARRRLCPDGACIGVIGDDGHCRVCGRAQDGSAPSSAAAAAGVAFDSDDGPDDNSILEVRDERSDEPVRLAGADHESASPGAFRPDRRLCDDGSCVGVIGAGDVCTVCGRPAGG